jgi:uncharacterized protein YbbK (DUF523 family)
VISQTWALNRLKKDLMTVVGKERRGPLVRVAASACLLGYCCRYDGRTSPSPVLLSRVHQGAVLAFCPEELGGLSTPRSRSHIDGGDGFDVLEGRARVVTPAGDDVTTAFLKGAYAALDIIRESNIEICLLKDKSPS